MVICHGNRRKSSVFSLYIWELGLKDVFHLVFDVARLNMVQTLVVEFRFVWVLVLS